MAALARVTMARMEKRILNDVQGRRSVVKDASERKAELKRGCLEVSGQRRIIRTEIQELGIEAKSRQGKLKEREVTLKMKQRNAERRRKPRKGEREKTIYHGSAACLLGISRNPNKAPFGSR
jgi:hypothetical protein